MKISLHVIKPLFLIQHFKMDNKHDENPHKSSQRKRSQQDKIQPLFSLPEEMMKSKRFKKSKYDENQKNARGSRETPYTKNRLEKEEFRR